MPSNRQRRQERSRREASSDDPENDWDDEGEDETFDLAVVDPVQDIEVEVEVVNPGKKPKRTATGMVAWIMDEVVPIPGTKVKIGLDPIMGMLPLGGELVASAFSCIALVEAMRWGLPLRVTWQMIGNILLNLGFGTIPVIGDIFSVIFRSNSRNRDILKEHLQKALDEDRKPSWGPIILTVGFIFFIVIGAIFVNLFLWRLLLKFLAQGVAGGLIQLWG